MTKLDLLEAALEERYEYLEYLKLKKERLDKLLYEIEHEIDDLVVKIMQTNQG